MASGFLSHSVFYISMKRQMDPLKTLKSERLYEGKVFNLVVDEVEYPSGNRAKREVAEHPGGAVIVALNAHHEVLLVRQFRYPMKKFLYELPAGKLSPDEDPALCAARELEEETGYIASHLEKLTSIYTSPGFCSEHLHIFLSKNVQKSDGGQKLEEGELELTSAWVPFRTVVDMIHHGEIVDSKTICGVFLAKLKLGL